MNPLLDQIIDGYVTHPEKLAAAELELSQALVAREIFFGKGPLPTYTLPYLLPQSSLDRLVEQSNLLASAIEDIAQATLDDAELFAALKLRPEAQELIRIDPGYKRITTLSRPDAIIDNDNLVFIEFNCDSPAMMNFADLVTDCLLEMVPLSSLRKRVHPERMTQKLLDALLSCYREFGGSKSHPTIAITDWPGQKTRYEHLQIAKFFQAAGYEAVICDPREFTFKEGQLAVKGHTIDIVYRRALFNELLDKQDEVAALLTAYRQGAICMVNSLRSYVASSKTLLAFLCMHPGLSPKQKNAAQYVARTVFLDDSSVKEFNLAPQNFVLKRGESHGGQHVFLPGFAKDSDIATALDEAKRDPWIMQRYHDVPKLTVLSYQNGAAVRAQKYFNWNPFIFDGKYAGAMARASDTPLINISLGGGLLPTLPYSDS